MPNIAFLGLGAMGSRMAAHLVASGHSVTVWNRDTSKTAQLRDIGADVAATPRTAAAKAEFVFSMVRDDVASRDVWLDEGMGALEGMQPGAIAIECSTLGLGWIRELSARCAARRRPLLDAPVVGSRPQAEQRQLIFLVGGAPEALARAEPVLLEMSRAVHHAGPSGAGAMGKLAANALFGIQVAAMGELIEAIRRQGFDPKRAVDILAGTPVCSPAATGAARSMLADAFAPMFPVRLVEKDFGYALAAAGEAAAPMVAAAHSVFVRAIREGHGADNLTAITRLYRGAA